MKKRSGIVILVFLALTMISNKTHAQCVSKGTVEIDAYYGFPNILSLIVRNAYQNSQQQDISVSGIGPVGIRGEYFITDHIAFGLDGNYSETNIYWKEPAYNNSASVYYSYRLSVPRLRILGKFNIHFGANDHFDWYAGAGIGYNNTRFNLTTNDPDYSNQDINVAFTLPVSARIDFGGKYFFTDNIGVGFEVGLGGPLASVGITAKF